MEILEYLEVAGASPFANWFNDLDPQPAAKVTVALSRIGRAIYRTSKASVAECKSTGSILGLAFAYISAVMARA